MWFLFKYWRYLAGALALIAIGIAILRYGHSRYEEGVAFERSRWEPQLIAAQRALAEANAKTDAIESAQKAATDAAEARHAEDIADLNARAADADSRFRALSVRFRTAAAACRGEVPAVPAAPAESDAATSGTARAERDGSAIADLARRCESDAAGLAALQRWLAEQAALRTTAP